MKEGKKSCFILTSETRSAENQGVDYEKVRREDGLGGNSSQGRGIKASSYCRIRFDVAITIYLFLRKSTVVPLDDP